ncbi:MAG: hypothetical protein ABSF91_09835 [Bacteroidota bacterium]
MRFGCSSVLVLISLLSLGCRDKGTEPLQGSPPGKRNYTWTVDTLAYPGSFQTLMHNIWANSPKNVYVVGHNDQNRGQMYHYDGNHWSPVRLARSDSGNVIGAFDLSAIYGFSASDIYAVGEGIYPNPIPPPNFLDSSLIIHFDGNQWNEAYIKRRRYLADVSGSTNHNVWAVGWGTNSIYHYDGIQWTGDSIQMSIPIGGFFQIYSTSVFSDSEFYALAETHINNLAEDIYYLLHHYQGAWSLIDSAIIEPGHIETKWGYSRLWKSPWGKLYSVGEGVYEWNQNQWISIFDSNISLIDIFGTSENNIFVVGQFGKIYHYNGTDWFQFTQFPPASISLTTEWFFGVWTDGQEVFIVGQDANGRNSIVLHGK